MPRQPDSIGVVYADLYWRDLRVHAEEATEETEGPKSRTISAQLVTYDTVHYPHSKWGLPVRLVAGSLGVPEDVNAVKFLRDHDSARVIGAMTDVRLDKTGLHGTFRLGRTRDAEEAFSLAQDGILDSVSVGYSVQSARVVLENEEEILEVSAAQLFEVSLVGRPADAAARIDAVTARKAFPMTTPTPALPAATPATDAAAELFTDVQLDQVLAHIRDNMAPAASAPIAAPAIVSAKIIGPDGKPIALASQRRNDTVPTVWGTDGRPYTAGDYLAAYAQGVRFGDWNRHNEIRAALADEITTDVPGLLPAPIIGELLGRASGRRPVWESLSPHDMPMAGAKFDRPKITQQVLVGDRGAEKTNPPSQKFKAVLEEVQKKVFAGGLDVSNEALDWTSPSLLNELVISFTRIYAAYTDTYASTQLVAAQVEGAQKVTWDGTPAKFTEALAAAAVLVAQGVGPEVDAFPNTAWISLDVWAQIAALTDTTGRALLPNLGPTNALGTFDLSDPTSGPSGTGFRWVVGRRLPAGTFILGDREFTESYENGRRLLQAQNVPQLGLDLATMGYGATYFPYPKTLVAIGPATPPPGATAASSK
jgi:HK97 family phage prohead protease